MIFRHKKYYFNPVTLTYEEIKKDKGHRMAMLSGYLLIALVFAFSSGFILNHFFGSKETHELNKEIAGLSREMESLISKGNQISDTLSKKIFVDDNTYRMILQMDTLPVSLRSAGRGGSAEVNRMARQNDLSYRLNEMLTTLTNQLQIQSGSFQVLYEKAMEYSEGTIHLPAIMPVDRSDVFSISTDFGVRSDPFFFTERNHNGLDFTAPAGKNVYATGDGIVTFARHSRTGYGNEIVIDHKFGFGSRYAHLHTINIKEGDRVKRGQKIGTVGQSGRATGPHLHYEVLYQQRPVNPSFYFDTTLTKEEFAQIINKANR